jgi:AMMECR1 domain-containing protein
MLVLNWIETRSREQVTTSATLLHDIRAVLDKLADIDTDYVVMGCIGITLPWPTHQTDLLQYAFAIAHDAARGASPKVRAAVADTMRRWQTYCALLATVNAANKSDDGTR